MYAGKLVSFAVFFGVLVRGRRTKLVFAAQLSVQVIAIDVFWASIGARQNFFFSFFRDKK